MGRGRRYRLGKREATVARTRAKIIEAARALLMRNELRGLALDEVARTAGVTRVTIYNQFGTRAGLLEQLFRDSARRMKVLHARSALAEPDPRDALHALVRANGRAWSRDRAVLQRVVALAAVDADASRLLAHFEGLRARDVAVLVGRLRASRLLARRVIPARATAAIVTLTSFQLYDQLVATGLTHAAAVETLVRMADTFLRPDPDRR